MTDTKQSEILRLAAWLKLNSSGIYRPAAEAAEILCEQHARIADLEAENRALKEREEAIGAGGVTGLRKPEAVVRFERAKGTTFDEMRDNLSGELYACGDTILVWVNEGDIIMLGAAIAQEGGK